MKFGKGKAGEPINKRDAEVLVKEMSGAEIDLMDEVLNSRRLAWRVAAGGLVFSLACLALAGTVVVKYAQPVPASILAYNTQDPASIQEVSLAADKASYGEIEDTFWLSTFVIAYESYDYTTIARYYDQVGLMATGLVADKYKALYTGKNAQDKVLGDTKSTTTTVISVLLDRKTGTATVRFKTVDHYMQRGVDEKPQYWIATIGYGYQKDPMTSSQRMLNPLGLKVASYTKRAEAANSVAGG
jgi:type IV secretion system protein VirB8